MYGPRKTAAQSALLTALALLSSIFCLLAPGPAAAEEATAGGERVEAVSVHLELTSGFVGAETLTRLESALRDTVESALIEQLGGDLAFINQNIDSIVETLGSVIGDVLAERGFTLEEMVLSPARTANVDVRLRLAETLVRDFHVDFYIEGSTELLETVIAEDAESVSAELYSTVAQTPYSDSAWLSSMVREAVERRLSALPSYSEFEQHVIVEPGETTSVAVILKPLEGSERLSEVSVRAHSYTMLYGEVEEVRDELLASLHSLGGLPMSFIRVNLGAIQRAAYQQLVNSPTLSCTCSDADIEMSLNDCSLSAMLRPNSHERMVAVQGRVDLWEHSDGDTMARTDARAGYFINDSFMLGGALSWFPLDGRANPMLGAAALLGNEGFVMGGYDFNAESLRLIGQHDLGDRFYMAADLLADGSQSNQRASEISLRYRLHSSYELQLGSNLDGGIFAAVAAGL